MAPDTTTRQRLLNAAKSLETYASEGTDATTETFAIMQDIVGRRPTREGGTRVEIKSSDHHSSPSCRQPVIHAYGAGGRGYEISWGVANEVAKLVKGIIIRQDEQTSLERLGSKL